MTMTIQMIGKNNYIRYIVQWLYIHLLIIPQMMKIQSQIIIHIKDRERYMCQLKQIEKS